MKMYTVIEVAELLHTNPETVRRWIRSGKIKSAISSNKKGHQISEEEFDRFLEENPKYAKPISMNAAIFNQMLLCNSTNQLAGKPGIDPDQFIEAFTSGNSKSSIEKEANRKAFIYQFQDNIHEIDAELKQIEVQRDELVNKLDELKLYRDSLLDSKEKITAYLNRLKEEK